MKDAGVIHVVKKGDTLYLLSKKYQISIASIIYANPYMDVFNLQVGDEIRIK